MTPLPPAPFNFQPTAVYFMEEQVRRVKRARRHAGLGVMLGRTVAGVTGLLVLAGGAYSWLLLHFLEQALAYAGPDSEVVMSALKSPGMVTLALAASVLWLGALHMRCTLITDVNSVLESAWEELANWALGRLPSKDAPIEDQVHILLTTVQHRFQKVNMQARTIGNYAEAAINEAAPPKQKARLENYFRILDVTSLWEYFLTGIGMVLVLFLGWEFLKGLQILARVYHYLLF